MNKQDVLVELRQLVNAGELSRSEVDAVFGTEALPNKTDDKHKAFFAQVNFYDLLYYVGGAIVFIGVCVLASQNWDSLGSVTRILVTLGGFIASFAAAVVLHQNEKLASAAGAFFVLSYLLLPLGLGVTLHEGGITEFTPGIVVILSALCTAVVFGALAVFKGPYHLFFGFVFATFLEFAVIGWLHSHFQVPVSWKREAYIFLAVGINYLVLGHYFYEKEHLSIAAFARFFGLGAVFISAMALSGWKPNANVMWEFLYPLMAFAAIFASLQFKSKLYLVFGLLALFSYIIKLSAEYFSNTLGWPLAIVMAGILIMASGYLVFTIRRKYQETPKLA